MNDDILSSLPHHGVLLHYCHTGVLLTGRSGLGKSDLALSLLNHGASLVCDDAPRFQLIQHPQGPRVVGFCDSAFYGQLYLRELGLIDIPKIYGNHCCRKSTPLDLILHLDDQPQHPDREPPLHPQFYPLLSSWDDILCLDLPYQPQRPMTEIIIMMIRYFYFHYKEQ